MYILNPDAASRELSFGSKICDTRCNARFQVLDQEKHRSESSAMRFLSPQHFRLSSTSGSDTRAAGNKPPAGKASGTFTTRSRSRSRSSSSSSSSSTSTFQPKTKSKIKSRFTVQNLRSLFHRHSNANGQHSILTSISTSISISSKPVTMRVSRPIAPPQNKPRPSMSPLASPAAEGVSNPHSEAAKPTSPSDAEMLFFLASQHEENLAKQRLQERKRLFGTDTAVANTDSEVGDGNATVHTGRWYRRQPEQDLRPGDDYQPRRVPRHRSGVSMEKPLPDLPERSLKRKDHFVRDKPQVRFRHSNSSVDTETDQENTQRSRRTSSGLSWSILPAPSTKPLLSPPLNKQSPSPLPSLLRSSYQRHQKSSSTSSKISEYLGSGADLFDQTRRELQSSLESTMDLFWREKIIDDSDSDESFFCIGEGTQGADTKTLGTDLEELDRKRKLSGKGHDPWTEGLLRECRLCRRPSPKGLKGLCSECDFDIRRTRPQSYDDRQNSHKREGNSMSEVKKPRSMYLEASKMAVGDPLPNQINSPTQRSPDHTVKAMGSVIDHTKVPKPPKHDSHVGIFQYRDGSPVGELTKSSSVRSVRSEPGIRASLSKEQPSGLQRRSSQSMRTGRYSSVRPSLESSIAHISRYHVTQGFDVSRSSRNMFDEWQTPEMRAQYKKQEQEYERWSPTLLEGDSTFQLVPPKSRFRRPNYSVDGENNEMKPEMGMEEGERMGRWKGKGVERSDVLYKFQEEMPYESRNAMEF